MFSGGLFQPLQFHDSVLSAKDTEGESTIQNKKKKKEKKMLQRTDEQIILAFKL